MTNDVFTLDENNNAAIRTLSVNGVAETNSPSVFTEDENGNACIRVTGGGGDSHNLGYFDTLQDLQTAYPTGEAGDWAIVAESDTVYIWDETQQAWVDTDRKGQVTSVNNQTGDVTIGINDILPDQTDKSGYVLGTDGFVAGWIKLEQIQRSAMPQASEEEVDKIYQYVGTTNANYTNGYFYKCVSDGGNPATYSWENIEVQEADALPSQTGNAGKFLQTDGTDASWDDVLKEPSVMPTLAVADWAYDSVNNEYRQTINVAGVTQDTKIWVSPFPVNEAEWGQCGVLGVGQNTGTITFKADVVPTNALGVNIILS